MRVIDIVISSLGIIILLPLYIIVSILVKLTTRGKIIYMGKRIGKNGREFRIYKFRSMKTKADHVGQKWPDITKKNDNRVTFIGKILRYTKIDETPQLVNVLKGEMSIVGPRPEAPCYVAIYDCKQKEILKVKPGITSPASIKYRNESKLINGEEWDEVYRKKILPDKIKTDIEYFRKRNIWKDIIIIFKTVMVVFKK